MKLVSEIRPDEIYTLAAQGHVQISFDVPEYTASMVDTGVLSVLETSGSAG